MEMKDRYEALMDAFIYVTHGEQNLKDCASCQKNVILNMSKLMRLASNMGYITEDEEKDVYTTVDNIIENYKKSREVLSNTFTNLINRFKTGEDIKKP